VKEARREVTTTRLCQLKVGCTSGWKIWDVSSLTGGRKKPARPLASREECPIDVTTVSLWGLSNGWGRVVEHIGLSRPND